MEKTNVRDVNIDLSLLEIYPRMNDINDESGNCNTSVNHDFVMSNEPVATIKETDISKGQPSTSHLQGQWYIDKKLEAKQRRRRRCRQRRREQKAEQRRLQPVVEKKLQKQEQPSEPHTYQRTRTWSELSADRRYYESHGYDDYLEENLTQALAAHNSDKMECEARWDQEQIKQLESLTITEQQPYSPNKTG